MVAVILENKSHIRQTRTDFQTSGRFVVWVLYELICFPNEVYIQLYNELIRKTLNVLELIIFFF